MVMVVMLRMEMIVVLIMMANEVTVTIFTIMAFHKLKTFQGSPNSGEKNPLPLISCHAHPGGFIHQFEGQKFANLQL